MQLASARLRRPPLGTIHVLSLPFSLTLLHYCHILSSNIYLIQSLLIQSQAEQHLSIFKPHPALNIGSKLLSTDRDGNRRLMEGLYRYPRLDFAFYTHIVCDS